MRTLAALILTGWATCASAEGTIFVERLSLGKDGVLVAFIGVIGEPGTAIFYCAATDASAQQVIEKSEYGGTILYPGSALLLKNDKSVPRAGGQLNNFDFVKVVCE